jgi:vacuolar-type H+-ATPase subunit F/Vma7
MYIKTPIIQLTQTKFRLKNRNPLNEFIMNFKDIDNINTANFILRHFVDLSARLLPLLNELTQKKHPTESEKQNIEKIVSVYKNYNFDVNTSVVLINSNVLELIKETFDRIVNSSKRQKSIENGLFLDHFLYERGRLQEVWLSAEAN